MLPRTMKIPLVSFIVLTEQPNPTNFPFATVTGFTMYRYTYRYIGNL